MWKLKASIAAEGAIDRRTGQMSRWQPSFIIGLRRKL